VRGVKLFTDEEKQYVQSCPQHFHFDRDQFHIFGMQSAIERANPHQCIQCGIDCRGAYRAGSVDGNRSPEF
jgi:hypothetical protein